MFAIEVKGLDEMREAFARYPFTVRRELEKATLKAGVLLLGTAKKEAPIASGDLRRSIKLDYKPIEASIYPTVGYAVPLHDGWLRTSPILPIRAKALRFKARSGKIVYVKAVYTPALFKGNPFMTRAVKRASKRINAIFNRTLENITNLLAK